MSESLYIRGEEFKKLMEFDVLHLAWECDSKGWVVEDCNSKRLVVLTNHGYPYIAHKSALLDYIRNYESVIEQTNEALALYH